MSLETALSQTLQPVQSVVHFHGDFALESGQILKNPEFAYQVWGNLNADKSNVIWVCHALTGNHLIHEWWGGLFGEGKLFDPNDYCIVSVNVLGSCYGTTGPVNSGLFRDFPLITIRDIVNGLEVVRDALEIEKIKILIGASVGGQQVLEWAILRPELFDAIIPIATNFKHSPFGVAFNEAQRLAIFADETYAFDYPHGGRNGLVAARAIGMISYRSYEGYGITQSEDSEDKYDNYKAASYQKYQGEKLANRFDAYSYVVLSKAMDSQNVLRNRGTVEEVVKNLSMPALVVGIDSDLLFPLSEQQLIAEKLPNAQLVVLSSQFGHDGFLVEFETLTNAIQTFIEKNELKK